MRSNSDLDLEVNGERPRVAPSPDCAAGAAGSSRFSGEAMAKQSSCRPFPLSKSPARRTAGVFGAGLLFTLLGAGGATAAGCPALQVTSLSPGTVVDGDAATLTGDGFCGAGSAFIGWIDDGIHGVPLQLQAGTTTQMSAVVGPVAASTTGTVHVIKGQLLQLPDHVVQTPDGLYSIRNTQLILGQETASGGAVKVDPGLPNGSTVVGSTLINGELVLQFPAAKSLQKSDSHDKSIAVVVVIQTCGEPAGDGSGDDSSNGNTTDFPIRIDWAGRFEGRCFGQNGSCTGGPEEFVARGVNDRFGAMGLQAQISPGLGGVQVTISHKSCSIDGGFATVEY